jgi:ABC-type multidrug transport system, ATPase and permease components
VYTIFPGLIINELIGGRDTAKLIVYIGVLIVTPVIGQTANFFLGGYLQKLTLALRLQFEAEFYTHNVNMDYESLENPDIQVRQTIAEGTLGNALDVVDELYGLMSAIVTLLALSSIIITLDPLVIVLIVCIVYIDFTINKKLTRAAHDTVKQLGIFNRLQSAYKFMLGDIMFAKEVRLFNINDFLLSIYTDSKSKSNKLELRHFALTTSSPLFNSVTNLVQQAVLYGFIVYNVINKALPIGNMTVYMSAAGQFAGALNGIFGAYLHLSQNGVRIAEYIEFMEIPLRQKNSGNLTPAFDGASVIEFVNVSFKYPGSENYALRNINLKIDGDKKLCIVGANGAGKTTFIKLLTRLYFPTEGEILLNGRDINSYDLNEYQRLFAPVFQDCEKFFMTLSQNITFSNEYDSARLDEICEKSGLSPLVSKLKKGYESQVGKWIDAEGFDPSGGEEQRISIARACYHGGEIFLLDEPTAALDPIAEYEIYTQFNEMVTSKCAVIITHRLSAVQLADKVAVFDNGGIIEYGTHTDLYAAGGAYTEMFDKQAKFYRGDVGNR